MDTSLVLSLQHKSCSKIVASLLNNKALPSFSSLYLNIIKGKDRLEFFFKPNVISDQEYESIRKEVTKDIVKVVPCGPLQKKLETFIAPLLHEIEEWLKTCFPLCRKNEKTFFFIIETIPKCWSTDGTIDKGKSVELLLMNDSLPVTNRFVFACTFCFYDHVMYLWILLSEDEKDYLRKLPFDLGFIMRQWIDWLESWLNKDWPFCVAWILGTRLWHKNVCVLKQVLLALTPSERSRYLVKYFKEMEVSNDSMRFCLSVMTTEDQELIFRESPIRAFRCISSWPLRNVFPITVSSLVPYLTYGTFKTILNIMSDQILIANKREIFAYWTRDCVSLMEILQILWSNRPLCVKSISKDHGEFNYKLRFVLKCDFKTERFTGKMCRTTFYNHMQKIVGIPDTPSLARVFDRRRPRMTFNEFVNRF